MKGKRTDVDWKDHSLTYCEVGAEGTCVITHELRKPNTRCGSVKFVNTMDFLAVTGDYGNWMFCRPFIPSATSDLTASGYWEEKLKISSTQEAYKFDPAATEVEIHKRLADDSQDYTDEEKDYLKMLLENVHESEWFYMAKAHMESVERFSDDHQSVPFCRKFDYAFEVVLDAFDEICRRYREKEDIHA